MFKIFKFLSRFARGVGFAKDGGAQRALPLLAVAASVVTGLASTTLLAVINRRIATGGSRVATLAWEFGVLCLLVALTRFASQVLLVRLGRGAVLGLQMYLSRQILAMPLRQLEKIGPSRLFTTLAEDVTSVSGAVTDLPLLCMHLAIVLSGFVYLGYLSWIALLMLLVCFALGVVSNQLLMARASPAFKRLRESRDELFHRYTEMVEGSKELKLHRERREAFLERCFAPAVESCRREEVLASTLLAGILQWGRSLFFVVIGLIVFVLPRLRSVSPEVVTGYALTLLFLIIPIETILGLLPDMGRAWVAIQRIERLGFPLRAEETVAGVDAPAALAPSGGRDAASEAAQLPAATAPAWRRLELADVRFLYQSENGVAPPAAGGAGAPPADAVPSGDGFSLGPLRLQFRAGEVVFLIGGNGSGKTTLGKLLVGLYAPQRGEILVDGEAVGDSEEARSRYRQGFSAVWSDFFLFESLLGFEPLGLEERAGSYLDRLRLASKVRVVSGQLSTLALSHGQRKRLALLMAYLEDRPSFLFDEWAADQDHEFKRTFYLELLPELKARGKTVFVITHDDHYFETADRIVKLDRGEVVFDGSAGDYQASRLAEWSGPAVPVAVPASPNAVREREGLGYNL